MKVHTSDQRRVDLDQARFVVGGSLDRCGWALQMPAQSRQRRTATLPIRLKSVVLCNRRLPVNFRYALLATEIARRRNAKGPGRPSFDDSGAV
jgi:hypothetical protein